VCLRAGVCEKRATRRLLVLSGGGGADRLIGKGLSLNDLGKGL
jgi:hypothetical protein